VFQGDVLLHQQMSSLQGGGRILQEAVQDRGGDVEGYVRDDHEGFIRKPQGQGVPVHHPDVLVVGEALPQLRSPVRIVLHGHHLPAYPREPARKYPSSGPELHHEVVLPHAARGDYPLRDPLLLEKVLAQLAPVLALLLAPSTVPGAVLRAWLVSLRHLWDPSPGLRMRLLDSWRGEARRSLEWRYDPTYSGKRSMRA
jgi:hypothetical protein